MTFQTFTDQFTDLVNLPRISNIGTDTTDTGYEVKEIAQQSGEEIMRRVDWPELVELETVLNGVNQHTLPADFHRLTSGGAVRGLSPLVHMRFASTDQWYFIVATPSSQPHYALLDGDLKFAPSTPAGGAQFSYVSKNFVLLTGTTPDPTLTNATDTILFPETLMVKCMVYRWRRQNGVEYGDHLAEFEADLLTEANAARGITA
jgi:hypothetical protein